VPSCTPVSRTRCNRLDCFATLAMTEYEVTASSSQRHCHSPRKRGIQYAAASRFNHNCLGILDRPVKPGDDRESVAADTTSRSRGAFRPSFALSLHPQIQEGAGKAGCRLAPAVRCAKSTRRKTAQQHTGVANHSAFPARWLDGLCRALPGAEFVLASLALAKFTDTAPVDADAASARA
jgi:hypothetical protein